MLDIEKVRADFPILKRTVHGKRLVYLDNSNTTQKPRVVIDALVDYYSRHNSNVHRAVYALAEEATELYEGARRKAAQFVGATEKELVFVRGTTEATNLVRFAWGETGVKKGDLLVSTLMEHHSNMVPWQLLAKYKGATLKFVGLQPDGTLDMDSFERLLKESPRLVAVTHCSNVLGTINDVAKICAKARAAGAITLVDGAQAAPHMPVDIKSFRPDFYAFSVIGDTPVLVRDDQGKRLIPIEEAVSLHRRGTELSILTVDERGKLAYEPVSGTLSHTDDVYAIRYEDSALEVETTAHHSVYVWLGGNIHEKKVSQLKIGDYLVTYNAHETPRAAGIQTFSFTYSQHSHMVTETIPITKELMRLVGYYLAEGSVNPEDNKVSLTFSQKEEDYVEDSVALAKLLEPTNFFALAAERIKKSSELSVSALAAGAGISQKTAAKYSSSPILVGFANDRTIAVRVDRNKRNHTANVCFNNKKWSQFFSALCGTKINKHLPFFAWDLGSELVSELLKGYLRGDASKIEKHRLVTKTVSRRLASEMSWLLKLHGISNSLGFSKSGHANWHDQYVLVIQRSALNSKNEFHRENMKEDSPRDRLLCVDGLRYAYKASGAKYDYRISSTLRTSGKRTTRAGVKRVIEWIRSTHSVPLTVDVEEILDRYSELADGDLGLVKVKSIRPTGRRLVYDVSVAKTERFFGGYYPILLHNSGHKMLGPTGIGALLARREVLEEMEPFQGGGEMIREVFLDHSTWNDVPYKFEAGTVNIADAIGLGAAVDYLTGIGMNKVREHEVKLLEYALQTLAEVKGFRQYGPLDTRKRAGVISFNFADVHPHDLATVLDEEGIAIRSGHHCAQPLMRWLDVTATSRASFHVYNSYDDVDALKAGLKKAGGIFKV